MAQSSSSSSGPNPLCEVGRTHPRDRHRMRPVEGHDHVWACSRHSIFATIVDKDEAQSLSRGDDFPMHDGSEGTVVRQGDERQGGLLIYYRAQ